MALTTVKMVVFGADSQRQRKDGDGTEAGALDENTKGKADVLPESVHSSPRLRQIKQTIQALGREGPAAMRPRYQSC